MCLVSPTLATLHSPTESKSERLSFFFQAPQSLSCLCVCVYKAMQRKERRARREGSEGFHFQNPLSSVYWAASSFQKVLSEATMQTRGCWEPRSPQLSLGRGRMAEDGSGQVGSRRPGGRSVTN